MLNVKASKNRVQAMRAQADEDDRLRQPIYEQYVAWAQQRNRERVQRNEIKSQFSKQWKGRIEAHLHLAATGSSPRALAASREQ